MASRMVHLSQHGAIVPRETNPGGHHAPLVTLRFARESEIPGAVQNVLAWGYRDLADGEAAESTWVALERGPRVVGWWWLQWGTPVDAVLHMCAAPGEVILTRRTLRALPWVAELFGAWQLLVVAPDEGPVAEYMRRLSRFGWQEVDTDRVFRLLTRRATSEQNL